MSIIGAIRWDAWYSWGAGDISGEAQKQFSAAQVQSRAPWFAQVISPFQLKCIGTQANMDTECQMAATSGIDYFAFQNYQPGSPLGYADANMSIAWNYYQASPNKGLVKWCWMSSATQWGSTNFADNTWQPFLANMATTQCTQSNYQKVLGTRPLVFVFNLLSSQNTSNMATAVAYFRSQCTGAGLGTPYMVMQTDDTVGVAADWARATACGLDAIGNYGLPLLHELAAAPDDYANLDAWMRGYWAGQAGVGKSVPTGCTGWDTRCRIDAPEANSQHNPRFGNLCYWSNPTPAAVASHVQALKAFVDANPTACEAQASLVYSWTECTEGSVRALIPTLGDPPVSGGTNLLNAIKVVLRP